MRTFLKVFALWALLRPGHFLILLLLVLLGWSCLKGCGNSYPVYETVDGGTVP